MSSKIDIGNVNKAEVLVVLYNRSRLQGMGYMHFSQKPMTVQEAEAYLSENQHLECINGRPIELDFRGYELDVSGYDQHNGQGAALKALCDHGLFAS